MNIDFQTITNAIGWALVHFLWQGIAIALGTAFLLQICRNARAQTRYLIACLGLVLCFLAPIWELLQSLQATKEFIGAQVVSSSFVESKAALGWIEQTQIWFQMHIEFIVISWAIVVAILGLRLSLGIFWLRSYSNGKRGFSNSYWQQQTDRLAEHFQIAKPVLVRIVNDLESPITIGWIRPMILIPASLVTGMTPSYLEALIAHELAHISRFDYVVNFIQNLIEMVLFFHPAVWWISKKIRTERENIADDLAASILGEPRRLALALQELELIQFTTPQLAQAAHGGNLMSRIKRLVRPEVQNINWKTAVTAVGVAAACVGLAANAAIPTLSQPDQFDSPSQAQTVTNKGLIEVDSMESTSLESPLAEQASTPRSEVNNVKDKGRLNKDVITDARIDFSKPGCAPEYPRDALRHELQGVTRLLVSFSNKGRIQDVDVLKSSGHVQLDDSVKNKLLSGECLSTPGTLNGKPQASKTTVEYYWKLDEPQAKPVETKENLPVSSNTFATLDFAKSGCSPEYPRASLRNQEQGTTALAVKINDVGVIETVKVTASSGFRGLDVAVAEKLRSGTCMASPAQIDGKNVDSTINVTYVWKLS
jgi:D-alanyl-D-alanine endopeptidase (penicillin-binding protein 7)